MRSDVGGSERRLRAIFAEARLRRPSVVFIDEIQALFTRRGGSGGDDSSRLLSQLLIEISECHKPVVGGRRGGGGVVVIAATNVPTGLDPALLSAGRLEHVIHVAPAAGAEGRRQALSIALGRFGRRGAGNGIEEMIAKVANETVGYTPAELANLCRYAALLAVREMTDEDEDESIGDDHGVKPDHLWSALQHFKEKKTALDSNDDDNSDHA